MIAINAATDWFFGIVLGLGARGIALSTTASVTVGAIMDFLLVSRYFRGATYTGRPYPLAHEIVKTLIAVVPVLAIALVGKPWIEATHGFVNLVVRLVLVVGTAVLAYTVMSVLLHVDGWRLMWRRVQGRVAPHSID